MDELNQFYGCFSHIIWRLHVNIRNYRKYVNDIYVLKWILNKLLKIYTILIRKFKSILIDVKLPLTDINQVLKNFNVNYEMLTKNYYAFLESKKNLTKCQRFHIMVSKSNIFFVDIYLLIKVNEISRDFVII
jgi:hypothetical protein